MMEGSGASRLYSIFGKDTEQIEAVTIGLATVTALPPEIAVQVDGDSTETPSEGIVIAEHLTEHTRTVSFTGGTISGNVDGFHGPGNLRTLEITKGELTLHCDLKIGDKVIVAVANDGQVVYILDKAVM